MSKKGKTSKSYKKSQPKRVNFPLIAVIAVLLIALCIILAQSFFGGESKETVTNSQDASISKAPSVTIDATPTSTANAPTKVLIEPLNAKEFVKEVVVDDNCNNPLGLVSYHDTENASWMKINSSLDSQNKYSEDGLVLIDNYLKNSKNLDPLQDINDWEFPFHHYCGGSSHLVVRELPGIEYPKTDVSKAFIEYTTQSIFGQVTVTVLAKKGDDYIQLTKYMDDKSLYEAYEKECEENPDNFTANEKCYRNKLLQDSNLYEVAMNQAKSLISKFAIK